MIGASYACGLYIIYADYHFNTMNHDDKDNDDDLIKRLFAHACAAPDEKAIEYSEGSWTYQQLFTDVCGLKNGLMCLNIEGPVVVCVHRTPRLISLLLALIWLEVPYIPVEPLIPLERLRAIVEDSKAAVLLHDTPQHETYMSLPCTIYSLHDFSQQDKTESVLLSRYDRPNHHAIAYIIYTSGTTGTPKGVVISRRALNQFLFCMSDYFLNATQEMLLATTTIGFDIAALELYLPIWQRKTIYLANQQEYKDPMIINRILKDYPITLLQGTPSFWNMLIYAGFQEKKGLVALSGGEPLTVQTANQILPCVSQLWNMYGPTEATIWCSCKQIIQNEKITIGRPIQNMTMMVLDKAMRPQPIGVKGELYIGGSGLAEGYLNRDVLTRTKFIASPLVSGQRLYRTGDVACMTDTGEFILFGRMDNQIKLHGYRIELEDIEAHIQACGGVLECAVRVYQEQLIAYICVAKGPQYQEKDLLHRLAAELPEFMVPKRFIYLNTLPKNASGKLDRKALPVPNMASQDEIFQMTPDIMALTKIWQDALHVKQLGIHDNFFDLGGHSLTAIRVVAAVQKTFGKQVSIQHVYHAPSIAEFIKVLSDAPQQDVIHPMQLKTQSTKWIPLTDFQLMMWLSNLFAPAVKQLNVVGRRRILGRLNQSILNDALRLLLQEQTTLSYQMRQLLPIQTKRGQTIVQCAEYWMADKNQHEIETDLNQSIQDLLNYKHWRKHHALIMMKAFILKNNQTELQVAMPHLIADQQSVDIFFKALSSAYLRCLRGSRKAFAPPSTEKTFEVYARHECQWIQTSLTTDTQFWEKYFQDTTLFRAPPEMVLSKSDTNHPYSTFFPIDREKIEKWRAFCVKHALTFNELLCAALGLTLFEHADKAAMDSKALAINMVKSTREDASYDEVLGCFLTTHAIKLAFTEEQHLLGMAKKVQDAIQTAAAYQKTSSLIKLGAIGGPDTQKMNLNMLILELLERIMRRVPQKPYYLNACILNACKRLARRYPASDFLVNVNIWQNFFALDNGHEQRIFGKREVAIPRPTHDVFTIHNVLDVCLFRNGIKGEVFMVISAHLRPEFRKLLGSSLLQNLDGHL